MRDTIPLKKIRVDEDRGRKDFSDIEQLSESIKQHGLIHSVVLDDQPDDEGQYRLIAGERRYRACALLGWSEIPFQLLSDLDPVTAKEVELEENVRRKDLSWPEEVEILRQIDELKRGRYGDKSAGSKEGWSVQDTAELSGQAVGGVSEQINVAKKLRENPELHKQVSHLPFSAAKKKIKQIEENERYKRLVEQGQVEAYHDLRQGDARELIKTVDDESVDLLVTDPPYGSSVIADGETHGTLDSRDYQKMLSKTDNMTNETVSSLLEELFPELHRVLKPGAHFYIFCQVETFLIIKNVMPSGLYIQVPLIVWDKGQTTSIFTGYGYQSCYELIIFGHKLPRGKRLENSAKAILSYKPTPSSIRSHPFHKPSELLSFLIKQSTSPGQLVLDPFAGSGSTIRAAHELSRQALGFEVDESNYAQAMRHLSDEND